MYLLRIETGVGLTNVTLQGAFVQTEQQSCLSPVFLGNQTHFRKGTFKLSSFTIRASYGRLCLFFLKCYSPNARENTEPPVLTRSLVFLVAGVTPGRLTSALSHYEQISASEI